MITMVSCNEKKDKQIHVRVCVKLTFPLQVFDSLENSFKFLSFLLYIPD